MASRNNSAACQVLTIILSGHEGKEIQEIWVESDNIEIKKKVNQGAFLPR